MSPVTTAVTTTPVRMPSLRSQFRTQIAVRCSAYGTDRTSSEARCASRSQSVSSSMPPVSTAVMTTPVRMPSLQGIDYALLGI